MLVTLVEGIIVLIADWIAKKMTEVATRPVFSEMRRALFSSRRNGYVNLSRAAVVWL